MNRVIVPIFLIVLGATFLIGCIYIPVTPHPTEISAQRKLYDSIGDANSDKPMRIGQVTRDQVLRLAREPEWASQDGRTLAYSVYGVDGYWVFPLCFAAPPDTDSFGIRLNFDDGGILRSYKFYRGREMNEIVRDLEGPFPFYSRPRVEPWPPPLRSTTQSSGAHPGNP